MKKLALILAIMLIPCTAFGMQMLDDNAMDSITGQAGVSIAVDDIQLFINIDKMAYIDCDGYSSTSGYGTCSGKPGAVALSNFQIDVLNINAIIATTGPAGPNGELGLRSVSCGDIDLFYNYADSTAFSCQLGSETRGLQHYQIVSGLIPTDTVAFQPRFLTIDVTDELPAATDGIQAAGGTFANVSIGGVLIGLPTVEIYINDLVLTPVYDGDIGSRTSTALNDDNNSTYFGIYGHYANYGTIELQGVTFSVLSGWVEIAPH